MAGEYEEVPKIHEQVTVPRGTHVTVQVDEGIADFLLALWTMGFETQFSCQGGDMLGEFGPMYAYVTLMGPESAVKLSALLGHPEPRTYEHPHWAEDPDPEGGADPKHWTWDQETLYVEPDSNMAWGRSVLRFPSAWLPEMTERAQKLVSDA